MFEQDLGRPSPDIEGDLETLPDMVADALRLFREKTAIKKHKAAHLLLTFKAKHASQGLTMTELKAMVNADLDYFKICMEEVTSESEYVRLSEKLMAAKKQASLRTAF
jgi:hypothetical protein